MDLLAIGAGRPVPQASAALVDRDALRQALEAEIEGEVRFDAVTRALYATDASVYQLAPLGVVLPATQQDLVRVVKICHRFRCPLTLRGAGTSQAGQAIGEGLVADTSKYLHRILEVNAGERWARVEPGVVLGELNAALAPHGLRFAPDISTANRATIGGMIANNSSGARSVYYGKTIDHVLELKAALSDGTQVDCRYRDAAEREKVARTDTLEGAVYRALARVAGESAGEVERRFPKVMRRVGGYNLDEFTDPEKPWNLAKLLVGSEGTLAVTLEAKISLVPLPKHKSVLAIEFPHLLDALGATPLILRHGPSAVEVMDKFILDHTQGNARLESLRRSFISGDPGGLLCVEFYAENAAELPPRMEAVERELAAAGYRATCFHAMDGPSQARIWQLREAALGLSMAMKEDAKSLSFVEDTAVAPEKLRDFIDRFLGIVRGHGTVAGVYAHASVGCLHVRPVVNLKTEAGIRMFESIASDIADLVLEYGGSLSGEHGDGMVRGPFLRRMFGDRLYESFRAIKRAFDPHGILNPGKLVDAPPLTSNLRYGAGYRTEPIETRFEYPGFAGFAQAVEMCSGVGACRKKIEGTMCPSYMATREETHSTRGRANVLRLAINGKLGEGALGDEEVKTALSLCLECRACKAECPVGVDVARFKSEFLSGYHSRHGTPWRARLLGHARELAVWGSRLAPLSNHVASSAIARWVNERAFGLDRRRKPPEWASRTLASLVRDRKAGPPEALLFCDTFTNYHQPRIGQAAFHLLDRLSHPVALAPNVCCGRPLISQGLLAEAAALAAQNTERLSFAAEQNLPVLFLEPSCLSAVREDAPDLLRGGARTKALAIARQAKLFEEYIDQALGERLAEQLTTFPHEIRMHGHCHQKAMGLLPASIGVLRRIPQAKVVDLDAGCCGMAGSFGYARDHFEVSKAIAERKLMPAARSLPPDGVLAANGFSCRHQVADFAGVEALHPVELLARLLKPRS